MVAFAVEPMGRALERPSALTPRRIRPEILQQGPAPQPPLGRALMAVQAPPRIHQPAQPVHRPVDRVARAMASRVVVSGAGSGQGGSSREGILPGGRRGRRSGFTTRINLCYAVSCLTMVLTHG